MAPFVVANGDAFIVANGAPYRHFRHFNGGNGDNKWRCHIQNRHQRLVAPMATMKPMDRHWRHCRHELLMAILKIASPFIVAIVAIYMVTMAIGCAIGDKNGANGENNNSS